MKLTISIEASNEKEILRKCIISLQENIGSAIDYEIIVTCNPSAKDAYAMLETDFHDIKIIRNNVEKGFCANHNIAIKNSNGTYVLILNADVVIKKGFIDELIKSIETGPKIGCVGGKLLSGDGSSGKRIIDTTGLVLHKNRQITSRGQGEEDKGQYDISGVVFGYDGAAMLCRREMLEDIKISGEYLDETFYAYKDDQDLCWRARLRGWEIMYDPKAVAYHLRGWSKERPRKTIPKSIRQHSFKNRYLLMLKNDCLVNWLRDLPFILWFEIKALIYMFLVEPHLLLSIFQVFKLLPLTLRKRREIMSRAVISPKEIRKWFK